MDIQKRYIGVIDKIDIMIAIKEEEVSSFIAHFGKFGDIHVWDRLSGEIIVNTKGIYLNKFYPETRDRKYADIKAKDIFYLFKDYKYQRKRKYPKGRLKELYKALELLFIQK